MTFHAVLAALQHHLTLQQIAAALVALMHQVQAHHLHHRQYNLLTYAKGWKHSPLLVVIQVKAGQIRVGW